MRLIKLLAFGLLTIGSSSYAQRIALPLDVRIESATNFNSSDLKKLERIVEIVDAVVNSTTFRDRVLNFTYKNQKRFYQNGGLNNEQIYTALMSGMEKFPSPSVADQTMQVNIRLFAPSFFQRNVIGYTRPNTKIISINRNFFRKSKEYDIAGNLVHEYLHKIGFSHDTYYSRARDSSVPYAIGYIVRDLGATLSSTRFLP